MAISETMAQHPIIRQVGLGIKSLMLHKLRSLLTMLGVVFGVGSVVAMLSVGEGAGQEAMDQIRRLGSNNILIQSVKPQEDEGGSGGGQRARMLMYGLTYDDFDRVNETFPSVTQTVPAKFAREEARLGERAREVRVVGTTPGWFDVVDRQLLAGRILRQQDIDQHAGVCVIGVHRARDLLATRHTLGQTVRIGGNAYYVVGIVQTEEVDGGGGLQTPDRPIDVYVPINVFRERIGDIIVQRGTGEMSRERVELHQMIVRVDEIGNVESTARAIQFMLNRFHSNNDFTIEIPLALLRQARETQRIFNIVLGSIAGISLLVGGIGIMNIMLASVTERTREIGVRRAIGAKRRQIITQFLIETVVLSFAGGLIGLAMGVVVPTLITYFAGMPTVVTAWSMILALSISALVGIVFGLYPAYRAATVDPIVALRHE